MADRPMASSSVRSAAPPRAASLSHWSHPLLPALHSAHAGTAQPWHTMGSLAREINPLVRGWMQYYGAFYRSALLPLLRRINAYLMRWLRKRYKRLASAKRPGPAGNASTTQYPRLFAHWAWVPYSWWSG